MKKIMLSVALLTAVVLTSCGKTACECLKEGKDIERKGLKLKRKLLVERERGMSSSSATVTAKLKELRAEADDLDSKCKGFTVEQYEKCK